MLEEFLKNDTPISALEDLFCSQTEALNQQFSTVIIGGGIAGILLALRLSRPGSKQSAAQIALIESQPMLGGRLFFSPPTPLTTAPFERFSALWESSKLGLHQSGFGFEILSNSTLESLERHLCAALSDEESDWLHSFCSQESNEIQTPNCYFIKKEMTTFSNLISGSSEIFTKRESEIFALLCSGDCFIKHEDESSPEIFGVTKFWVELSKAAKDSILPLLETICGSQILKLEALKVTRILKETRDSCTKGIPTLFLRRNNLNIALEILLRCRGVNIFTSTSVQRLEKISKTEFEIRATHNGELDDLNATSKRDAVLSFLFKAKKIAVTVPHLKMLSFLSRDDMSPPQSKLLSRARPQSLVAVEFSAFKPHRLPLWSAEMPAPGTRFIFPVERAEALVTSQDTVVFYTRLDFEDSLQAPAVREGVSRLRRAAARMLDDVALKISRPGMHAWTSRSTTPVCQERIILCPIAWAFSPEQKTDLREVRMAKDGLYCCGDSFSWDEIPWKNLTTSVHEISKRIDGLEG